MAIAVEMPKMSDTMEEGVLVAWLVEEGAKVSAGDVIAQVETDKATMDLEAYDDGVLLKRVIGEGESVPIGALIAVLGKEGEDPSELLAEHDAGGAAPAAAAAEDEQADEQADDSAATADDEPAEAPSAGSAPRAADGNGRVKASPLARKLAGDYGIDLSGVQGSGPEGRIVKRDVEALREGDELPRREKAPATAPAEPRTPERPARSGDRAATPAGGAFDSTKISQMRKTISRRLSESKFTAPHFYLDVDLDVERLVAFRAQINALAAQEEGGTKVSVNDLITKACALALRQHPAVNGSYLEAEGEIRHHHDVHVAVAVAVDEGLLTPVIRHADRKGLAQIAKETRELAGRARDRKLQPEEFEGSTFTTSNLGMFGIESFTAIINPPNACILAIGAIREVPVVKDGAVVPGKRMKVTLSCDHRLVDGASGAAFLATLRGLLEEPMRMLL